LSLTKHYACGDTILGAVIGPKANMKKVLLQEKISGIHITDEQCITVSNNSKNIKQRMESSGKFAFKIAAWLKEYPKVNTTMYPMLPNHPSCSLAKDMFTFPPSCIYFHLSMNKEQVDKAKTKLSLIRWETSFGDSYCKIDNWWKEGFSNYYDQKLEKKQGIWFRLSCGYKVTNEKAIQDELEAFIQTE